MCKISCTECPRKVYSSGVSVVTVDTVDTLVIDVPAQSFNNCQRGCLVVVQSIPAAATINMPVAVSIGGDTTTVYPLTSCRGQAAACSIRTRVRYPFRVITNSTGGVFRVLKNLSCAPNTALNSSPVADATTGG